jgi:hypothetical protein
VDGAGPLRGDVRQVDAEERAVEQRVHVVDSPARTDLVERPKS